MLELNTAAFTYIKSTGERSQRRIIVLSKPSDSYLGFDVSDGDLSQLEPYFRYQQELRDVTEELKAKHGINDLKLPFKRFKEVGISKLTESQLNIFVTDNDTCEW